MGNLQHVRGEEYGIAGFRIVTKQCFQQVGSLGVESHHRLIQYQQFRIGEQCCNDGKLLLHSMGIGCNLIIEIWFEQQCLGQGIDALVPCLLINSIQVSNETQVLVPAHLLIEVRLIRHIAYHTLVRWGLYLLTLELNRSLIAFQQAHQHLDRGAFSGSVGAKKAEDLTVLDCQAQIINSVSLCMCIAFSHM